MILYIPLVEVCLVTSLIGNTGDVTDPNWLQNYLNSCLLFLFCIFCISSKCICSGLHDSYISVIIS